MKDQKLPDGAVKWARAADAEAFVDVVRERAGISSGTGYWDEEVAPTGLAYGSPCRHVIL